MSEVVKAGVLEVTVVQATGVDLLYASSALSRSTRRKPALVARVTVDGATKSGQPAQRSHHPVWFPAKALNPSESIASSWSAPHARGGSRARSNSSTHVFGRTISSTATSAEESGVVVRSIDRTTDRYGGGVADGGDGGRFAESCGEGGFNAGDGGRGGRTSVARGLLFEVREFYGPTRIVVELVSGGGSGGGGGTGGGTVVGACEARLAEALVGRGGGSGSSKLEEAASLRLGKGGRPTQQPQAAVLSPTEETRRTPTPAETRVDNTTSGISGAGGDYDADSTITAQAHLAVAPSHSAVGAEHRDTGRARASSPQYSRQADAGAHDAVMLAAPVQMSTAAGTADTANSATFQACAGCLPVGGVFGHLRRRRRVGRPQDPPDSSDGTPSLPEGNGGRGVGNGGVGSRRSDKASDRCTGRKSWSRSTGSRVRKLGPRKGSGTSLAAAQAAGESNKPAASSALTLEQVEMLATSDWGRGGANGSARDMWKDLVHVGGGGNAGKGKGAAGGGSRLGPAVRMRLRFIPLWDCLTDGGGINGLGALHAAARDGDARLVTSLAHLWQSLSPGSQVLTLPCRRGLTPIQHCIEAGKEDALRELLRGIARDSLRGEGQEGKDTPLHTAVKAGEEGMLRMLLAQTRRTEMPARVLNALRFGLGTPSNTMVDSVGSDGLTPLALSAMCGDELMVKCLLEEGANAAAVDARGMTPIAHAARGGHLLAVRALLKAKPTGGTGSGVPGLRRSRLARMACAPCKTNEDGMGPVALAAASGSAHVVSELLRADIPFRTRDRDGRTPLHIAARFGHVAVLRVLVEEMRKDKGEDGTAGGGGGGGVGRGVDAKAMALPGDNTLMMDGGPFKLCNFDLHGRTAHATALLHEHPQAAAFLEAAAAELEPEKPKDNAKRHSKRRGAGCSAPGGKGGHPPRASTASPVLRLAQGSGSGSAQGSGTSGRPSPVSSGGLGSCNSYEYVESDQE